MSFGFQRSGAAVAAVPTGAPAFLGAYAAALAAAQVSALLTHAPSPAFELFVDVGFQRMLRSALARNPACRFDHERWELEDTGDVRFCDLLLIMDAVAADLTLAVAGDAFLEVLRCGCAAPRRCEFLLAGAVSGVRGGDPERWRCPNCGGTPLVTGFDRHERIAVSRLSPATTHKTLGELGLRTGDVLDFDLGARGHRRFVLRAGAARAARRVVVVGLGNIGSFLVPLVARDPAVEALVVIDPDSYDASNLATQNLSSGGELGRSKALVQADNARRIRPDLQVEAYPVALEDLPWGVFAGAIVVGALDSRLARMRLQERAWRMGSVFVDTAVGGAALQARASVYPPCGSDGACHECLWNEDDYVAVESEYPCAAARAAARQ